MTVHAASDRDVQDAIGQNDAIRVRGSGTKSPVDDRAVTLDISSLRGVVEYSADECVLTALAGTPLLDIEGILAAHGQYLPFDPPFAAAGATIGGTAAAGVSGSLRYRYGGVRDFVIGARIVDGEGRSIRSGGKVVKNAAGFLLHHAMVGSAGRFGVLTELTLKVFPSPEARGTVVSECGTLREALSRARALEAQRLDLEALDVNDAGTLWVRVAGRAAALQARIDNVMATAGGRAMTGDEDTRIWKDASEFAWAGSGKSIVKVPLSGSVVDSLVSALTTGADRRADSSSNVLEAPHVRITCGGRCAWIATSDVTSIDAQLASAGHRGVVIRGPAAGERIGRTDSNVFEERVRRVLDPCGRFRAASDSR